MRELSLREGDTVKIYSKIGGDQGWWKGEANGRVRHELGNLVGFYCTRSLALIHIKMPDLVNALVAEWAEITTDTFQSLQQFILKFI